MQRLTAVQGKGAVFTRTQKKWSWPHSLPPTEPAGPCKAAALDVSSRLVDILGHEGGRAIPPAFPLAKSLLARS